MVLCVVEFTEKEWEYEEFSELKDMEPWKCFSDEPEPFEMDQLYKYKDGDKIWWVSEYPVCPQLGWTIYPPDHPLFDYAGIKVKGIEMFSKHQFVWVLL
jgi:hypothetical protein